MLSISYMRVKRRALSSKNLQNSHLSVLYNDIESTQHAYLNSERNGDDVVSRVHNGFIYILLSVILVRSKSAFED